MLPLKTSKSKKNRARTKLGKVTQLAIVYRDIDKLQPDSKNPRVHSEKQIQQVARSIEAFGFNVPFLVDRRLKLIAGHGRLAACKLLGITIVPTIGLDHLTEEQTRAYVIADNRLTENADWDDRLLGEQLKALAEVKLDFSLEATGFEMGEIDLMIEGLASPLEAEAADTLPKMSSPVPVTKPGDIWLLGPNRLMCGDARIGQTYQQLMDGQFAAAVFTDPPHNHPIDGYVTAFGKVHHAARPTASGEITEGEFTDSLSKVFANLIIASAPGSIHFVCTDWQHLKGLLAAAERKYAELINVCVWVKEGGHQGSLYRNQHELVFVFESGTTKRRNVHRLGKNGRYRTNVWQYPRVNPGCSMAEGATPQIHPSSKPVAMVAEAIMDCTARGEIVLDPFLGSGATLVAAERVGRSCYGIELDPSCVDLAIRRWQAYTGNTARHAQSKHSFNDLEEVQRGQ
jgi:DNA modification methylase